VSDLSYDHVVARSRPRHRAASRRTGLVAAAGALIVVLGVAGWATGGFDEAKPPAPVTLRPGQAFDQGRFEVRVLSARVVSLKEIISRKPRPNVDVVLRVVNKDTSTISLTSASAFQDGFTVTSHGRPLTDDRNKQRDEATLKTSLDAPNGRNPQLHPDFPAEVHTIWALRDGPPPGQVTVGLREWTWVKGLTQPDHWEPGRVAAQVTLKVAR
jgi:hypothetical protein